MADQTVADVSTEACAAAPPRAALRRAAPRRPRQHGHGSPSLTGEVNRTPLDALKVADQTVADVSTEACAAAPPTLPP
ncbi:hypothetical protein [Streptomyces sp. NPDC052494]|uniref:hypothetical protein n=1 Tax=Streptomyces sp. NPDC052494 TaxID=3365692 RepID=UPI0037D27CDF